MIETGAHKEILSEDYKRHRQLAEKFHDRGEFDRSASHYRKSANLLDEIADLDTDDALSTERRKLADDLREAATTLENAEPRATRQDTARTAADPTAEAGTGAEADVQRHERPGESTGNDERDAAAYLEDPPDIDFDDVGGMTELKQTLIDKIIDPLERPELYEKYDLGVVNGVLLYGPPGTGKTYITRALAGKLGYQFVEISASDITSSLVGEAADNVAELFDVARENQPCILFIDEIDGIAGSRSGGAQKTQSERQMVNQLLTELSEVQGEDVVVIAATNIIDEVDDAIKRSGRFDERIEVPPPDADARVAILRVHLRTRPVLLDEIDWDEIKQRTEGYTASDMELIATNAARAALNEARENGEIEYITQRHLEDAIGDTESSLRGWNR